MHRLHVFLNDTEHRQLMKQVKATGLSKSALVRKLIIGLDIRARPPTEYVALLREMSAIGNNLNQLVRIVNANKKASYPQLEECRKMFSEIFKLVKDSL